MDGSLARDLWCVKWRQLQVEKVCLWDLFVVGCIVKTKKKTWSLSSRPSASSTYILSYYYNRASCSFCWSPCCEQVALVLLAKGNGPQQMLLSLSSRLNNGKLCTTHKKLTCLTFTIYELVPPGSSAQLSKQKRNVYATKTRLYITWGLFHF